MKSTLLFLALLVTNLIIGQNEQIQLSGEIEPLSTVDKMELHAFNAANLTYEPIAYIDVSKDGQFHWNGTFQHPNLFQLKVGNYLVPLAIDQAENIQIKLNFQEGEKPRHEVYGSSGTTLIQWFPKKLRSLESSYFGQLKKDLEKAITDNNKQEIKSIEQKVGALFPKFVADIKSAAVDTLGISVAAYTTLPFIDPNKGLDILQAMAAQFQEQKPNLPITQALTRHIAKINGLGIGNEAPDFELTDLSGNSIKLSDFKGKYVYLDFWASWCLACRVENPKLAQLFQTFQGNQFTMLGVAIKEKEEAWKKAIKKDQLPWQQLLDVQHQVGNLYKIESLPQNVLINPEGIIIARNLKAEELKSELETLFKS